MPRSKIVSLEREGVRRALNYVLKLSKDKIAITPKVILNIHNVGFGFIFPDWAGKFRIVDVIVGMYEPPHYSRIPELIKNLCDDLAERLRHLPKPNNQEKFLTEIISFLAWFQSRFAWIHPFKDYNGRIARLLTNLLALNLGLPAFEIKADGKKDRDLYIEAMKAADKQDFSLLENLLADALEESLQKSTA